ncbi:hypothetical protein VPH35_057947 [Triticum aestivum]|uniref:Uncharacterized protein n=1 Tax=Triticum aestivum TaxID=4565 RepID=A0A3B6GQD0_WHEAT|nr:uncharacterized protein LOC123073939 [Triticum aestivum]
MPPIAADKEELDRLYNLVAGSVVLLLRSKDGDSVDFGTGIVLFSDESRALIGVDNSQIKDGETITVRFHDSTQSVASVFLKKTTQKHAVLLVYSTARPPPVRFNVSPTTRQDIFMLGVVEKDETLGLMTGTVGNPNCRAVDRARNHIYRSESTFAVSCPMSGRSLVPNDKEKIEETKEITQLIGAPVFDMSGLVIGTIDCADPDSYNLKFAIKTNFFLDKLEKFLKDKDEQIYLSRGEEGTGTSGQGSSTSAPESKKRERADSPPSDTRKGKSLCMDQLEANMAVVSEEQLRLHKSPGQVEMDFGRREATQRALMRLVTPESDDEWRSSPSSSGLQREEDKAALKDGGSKLMQNEALC